MGKKAEKRVMTVNGREVMQDNTTYALYVDGKLFAEFGDIVKAVAAELFRHSEKLLIAFNRDRLVYFKSITKTVFLKNPKAFLYLNAHGKYFGYGFKFLSEHAEFLLSLPDVLNENGETYTISQSEYAEKYNHYIPENKINYGNVNEFHISQNIADLEDKTRNKKNDVWTHYITINGTKSKCKVGFEMKSSMAGDNNGNTDLISYNEKRGIKALSGGYSKSNEFIKFWL